MSKRYLIIYDYASDQSGWLVVEVSEAPKLTTHAEAKALKEKMESERA